MMNRYNKLWAAVAGAMGVVLVEYGYVDVGQWQSITTAGISILSAIGVYQVRNHSTTVK